MAAGSWGALLGGDSLQRRLPASQGGLEALPGSWPLLRHALTGLPHHYWRRASSFVELRAGSSSPKTILTPRLR